jgi:hypothetical protein
MFAKKSLLLTSLIIYAITTQYLLRIFFLGGGEDNLAPLGQLWGTFGVHLEHLCGCLGHVCATLGPLGTP